MPPFPLQMILSEFLRRPQSNAVELVNAEVVQRCSVLAARGRGGALQSVIF